ncbi:hypothetical protein RDV77_01550 [Porphyromonadaceae sp. NP-X]|nr:hypothetical protein [Porphyromonadaceae sp. NP-X]
MKRGKHFTGKGNRPLERLEKKAGVVNECITQMKGGENELLFPTGGKLKNR